MALFGSTAVRIAGSDEKDKFAASRKAELDGLLKNETFKVVKRSSVLPGTRIYGSRFIDAFKTVDGTTKQKSRLVAHNYLDEQASVISTKSPTIQRCSQRIVCATAASMDNHKLYNCDMPQAYPQSKSCLLYTSPSPRDQRGSRMPSSA